MPSKNQKVLNLIISADEETSNLGQKTLASHLTENNVVYFYLTLEKHRSDLSFITEALNDAFIKTIGFPPDQPSVMKSKEMAIHLKNTLPDKESVETFMEFYKSYLYNVISQDWPNELKKQNRCL